MNDAEGYEKYKKEEACEKNPEKAISRLEIFH
jgi:hypothetical protein